MVSSAWWLRIEINMDTSLVSQSAYYIAVHFQAFGKVFDILHFRKMITELCIMSGHDPP
jgi:hypothetical protein